MGQYVIPTRTDLESYEEEVSLDGVSYLLSLVWNARDGAWYMSLAKKDGTPVASGLRVVADFPLLRCVSHAARPAGELMAVDTSGAGSDPGLTDLGGRVLLMYNGVAE